MKNKISPFLCPRCGYESSKKWDMRRHLYNRSTICPGEIDDIELTEDIKKCIINNKVYRKPKEKETVHNTNTTIINSVIQNYNSFNNMLASIDVVDRIMHVTTFKSNPVIDLETSVEDKYSTVAEKLDNNSYQFGFELNHEDMLETIDDVSNTKKEFQNFNIIYDPVSDKLKIYDGEWEDYMLSKGIKKMLSTIKSYYWDAYECYLLRKLKDSSSLSEKQRSRELLDQYYHFICCFNIDPFVKGKSDAEILGEVYHDTYDMEDTYYPRYVKQKEAVTKTKTMSKDMTKKVIDIIKHNNEKNIRNLNREVYDIFSMDNGFRNIIMTSLQGVFPKDLSAISC